MDAFWDETGAYLIKDKLNKHKTQFAIGKQQFREVKPLYLYKLIIQFLIAIKISNDNPENSKLIKPMAETPPITSEMLLNIVGGISHLIQILIIR